MATSDGKESIMSRSSFRRPLTIFRYSTTPTLKDDGTFVNGNRYPLTIMASVQPLRGKDLQALPEGRRGYRAVNIYTDELLITADQMTGTQADRFKWFGSTYEVVNVTRYPNTFLKHFEAQATEVNDH